MVLLLLFLQKKNNIKIYILIIMKRIDILNLFLIIFILYYLINGKVIEGNDPDDGTDSSGTSSRGIKCQGNTDATKDVDCSKYPLRFRNDVLIIDQCQDGTTTCEEIEKEGNCCIQRTEMCQGNLDSSRDIICDDGSWPKVDSSIIPSECRGSGDENPNCWMVGKPSLSELTHSKRQSICCTSRNDFILAEKYWGIPYLISKASKKYDDSKLIRGNGLIEDADKLLNEALEILHDARELDTINRYITIPELIRDWGTESGHPLGTGMCNGNIDKTENVDCLATNQDFIDNPFIQVGNSKEKCCKITGLCSGNTNSAEDISCPQEMTLIPNEEGNSIAECCKGAIKCRGNENVNLNFNCPQPLIPVSNSEEVIGSTKEKCCRHPDDKSETELTHISENKTISGTIIINADFLSIAGLDGSGKRKIFENNFKKDISNHINSKNKINISSKQVVINKVYKGSIIIDFQIIPDKDTNISITKEYFSYLFSGKVLLPNIGYSTSGGVTNVKIISWYNIEHWPDWIWYFIVGVITFLISLIIFA
mgnify:FL=1